MAAGDPTGADLTFGTTNGNTLATYGSWTEREITFGSPIELTSGTKYAIVVKAPDIVGSAELYWSTRIDNPYANGDRYGSSNSGSSWTIDTDDDVWFKTKASGVEKDDGSFTQDGFNRAESVYGTNWSAQTFTASSTYTISSVVLKLAQYLDFGGSVETVTVSIKATDLGLPGTPTTPSPGHTDTEVDFSGLTLSWVSGGDTDTYNVWVGDSGELFLVSEGQIGTSYITTLDEISSAYDDKIYWAIDAINDEGTTTGDTWYFDARPGQVSTFTPLNGATGLTLSEVGSTWDSPSANTDTYDVYFGIESGSLVYVGNTVDLLLDLVGIFPTYNHTYYWEIDAVNDFGVTLGNEVSFATISFYPPLPTGVTLDGDGNPTGTPTGVNNMITIRKLVVAANSKIWYESI